MNKFYIEKQTINFFNSSNSFVFLNRRLSYSPTRLPFFEYFIHNKKGIYLWIPEGYLVESKLSTALNDYIKNINCVHHIQYYYLNDNIEDINEYCEIENVRL